MQILESLSNALTYVSAKVSKSVVKIDSGGRRGGTGVVWSPEGHIVTAAHVLGRSDVVEVEFQDGKRLDAKVLGRDADSDVALLKVEATGLTPIELGESGNLQGGQFVLAFANSLGGKPSVTSGIVTSPKRSLSGWGNTLENAIVTDALLNPGYSGGPLADASGKMVGLDVAYFNLRGIAVPVDSVKAVAADLLKEGRVKRAYLGVYLDEVELPSEVAQLSQVGQASGLMVLSAELDSPAKRAGLAMGDVIVRLAGKPTATMQDLHGILGRDLVGKSTTVSVLRGEKPVELPIVPSEHS